MTENEMAEVLTLIEALANPSHEALMRAKKARRRTEGDSMPSDYLVPDDHVAADEMPLPGETAPARAETLQ
ncbi:hypothetical protein ACLBXM_12435 [Xanthobacteraceae bacterium A53D]